MPHPHDEDAQLFVYLSWKTQAELPLLDTDEVQQAAHLAIASRTRTHFGRLLAIGSTPSQVHMVVRFPASLSVSVIARTSRVSAQEAITQFLGVCGQPAATAPLWDSAYIARTVSREDADQATAYLRARIADAKAAALL